MEIELKDLQDSKIYTNPKREMFVFKHPMDYLQPFIEKLSPLNPTFKFQVDSVVENINPKEEDDEISTKNTSYGRVSCIATIPDNDLNFPYIERFNHLTTEIGFVYALDTQKPEIKVFKGKRVSVCTNQCIFGADNVRTIQLTSINPNEIYDDTQRYVDNFHKDYQYYIDIIEKLYNEKLYKDSLDQHVGHIMRNAIMDKRLGIQPVIDAVRLIHDSKTHYYCGSETNKWITYNAVTESLKKSNIIDEATKTNVLHKIFLN